MSDQPHYPYRDGDHAVLGPDVTAAADGMTIRWKGANYRRDHGQAEPVGLYRHYKGGLYEVTGTAIHTETQETLVVYRDASGQTWARPISNFTGIVDGQPRFTRVTPEPAPAAAEATEPHTGLVVQPYRNDRGERAWVFRCWGSDSCDGWLSLDHTSEQSAERARDRHVAEEHAEPGELTADEARGLVDELGLDLYRAQDALAFVGECCTIAEHEQRPITTADVREWLKGARCGRQLAADAAAATEPATVTDPGYLRQQYTAIIGALHDNRPDHIATELLRVRDRHLQQLRQRLQLADELLATRDAELAAAKKTARGIGAWGVLQAIEQALPQGPTVAEAAADDARWWNGEKAGE